MRKRQEEVAKKLKALAMVLAVFGVVFFCGMTWYRIEVMKAVPNASFGLIIAMLYFTVLYHFRDVCTQIGRDNSFSPENAKSFRYMAYCGAAAGVVFAVKLAVYFFVWKAEAVRLLIYAGEIFAAAVFYVICSCLSELIRNAYEIKRENELTI